METHLVFITVSYKVARETASVTAIASPSLPVTRRLYPHFAYFHA